jgi:tRNA A-37 threonylcarbamoyl transferase component Bud32
MTEQDDSFQQALRAWLNAHADAPAGVSIVELAGRRCVIKRRSNTLAVRLVYWLRWTRSWALSWVCWLAFKERPSAHLLLKNALNDEASRLRSLRAAGCRVPEMLYQAPGVLVLDYVGQDLPYLIRIDTPAGRLEWMRRAATDLAQFHLAGFVHGGAQLRNLMYQHDVLTRIDFEENIGEAMSRPLGQAYDVYQMISSMAGLRQGHQFDGQDRLSLCQKLLEVYLEQNPDPLVKAHLQQFGRAMAMVTKRLGWILGRLKWRDVQGFMHVCETLRV